MKRIALVVLAMVLASGLPGAADAPLLDSPSSPTTGEPSPAFLQSGADPNMRDTSGASALMYATLYASTGEMRQLLERGADVNAANAAGATALMWAARNAEKVSLLLGHGAAVNARTRTGCHPTPSWPSGSGTPRPCAS